jgi:hypothetical protein
MRTLTCLLAAAALLWLASPAMAAEKVSIETLLNEMTDREALARFPSPAYKCAQASSYDRDSVTPDNHNAWMANADRSQFVRIEEKNGKKEYVMMDEEGPGAIVRFWGTWHGPPNQPFSNGTLRVYLDGSDKPAIEGPIQDIISKGKLVGAPLSQGVSPQTEYGQRGHNLYLPIPYAKHCKVTYSTDVEMKRGAPRGSEALYYQINFRTYEPGTEVESFSMERLAAAKATVDKTLARLKETSLELGSMPEVSARPVTLAAGKESEAVVLEGPGAITGLKLKLAAKDLPQALRSTVLKIEFDGQPCVWVPVGDFFGIGYQVREYKTWYTQVTKDGEMSCAWVMPYEKEAKISLINLGDQNVEIVKGEAHTGDWKWDDRSMHFASTWHELRHVETRKGSGRPGDGSFDVNYVTVDGKGVYVGDTLTLFNGAAHWWGEGDEKIYVDGEDFPSHFGTGTEDYYGYAWCRPEAFSAPFHAQPEGNGNLRGGFSVNSRYRALDAIPFNESLKFDMELWHWGATKMNFAPTTFFYARPGARTNIEPLPDAAAQTVTTSRTELGTVYAEPGALEGENMKVASRTGGSISEQIGGGWGWSNEAQLWWQDAEVGDELVLEFPVEKAGKYKVVANLTKANDYADIEIWVNDKKVEGRLDRYNESVASSKVELGTHELKEGTAKLKIRIAGKNPKAIPRHMVGIDYLKLEAAN